MKTIYKQYAEIENYIKKVAINTHCGDLKFKTHFF